LKVTVPLVPHSFDSYCSTYVKLSYSKTIGVLDIGRIRLRHQLSFYGVPFALGNVTSDITSLAELFTSSFRSGRRD
ncbi:hypothetical protein T01_14647, partial [Trichinella spiralis]